MVYLYIHLLGVFLMNTNLMFSSETDLWSTPQYFYDELNKEFEFTLDPCANYENAKCKMYFTEIDNGLEQEWAPHSVFMNPPYGRSIGKWIKKAHDESLKGATVVCLVPARTDTRWFHDWIYRKAEIRFVKGRLKFGKAKYNAPFPCMIVIYK
jgi:phage N-6-adenine-methyltransferase